MGGEGPVPGRTPKDLLGCSTVDTVELEGRGEEGREAPHTLSLPGVNPHVRRRCRHSGVGVERIQLNIFQTGPMEYIHSSHLFSLSYHLPGVFWCCLKLI